MPDVPRRGWRETVEQGLYRSHRVACPSSRDRRPGRRCRCPFQIQVPSSEAGRTRFVSVDGTVGAARAMRRRLLAEGRPAPLRASSAPVETLDDFAAVYLRAKSAVLAANTVRNREDDYRHRISSDLGHLRLEELTRHRIELWLADLIASASSRRMVVQTVATLRVMLATAVEWGSLSENHAVRLRLPREHEADRRAVERVLAPDQLSLLFSSATTLRTETMLRAAGEAGLRRGEVAGLRWPDVLLPDRRVEVRRAIVQERRTAGRAMRKIDGPPKGGRARRVAISRLFAERLGDFYAESVVEGGSDAAGFVWPGRDGGPMHDRSLARALERACRRGGLVDDQGTPLVTPHGLRHTSASVMLAAGVPLIVVSRQLGHANPHITATIYAHLLADAQLDDAASAFDGIDSDGTMRETMRELSSDA